MRPVVAETDVSSLRNRLRRRRIQRQDFRDHAALAERGTGAIDRAPAIAGRQGGGPNLAARMAHGDIFIVTDCDCSFEPEAIAELLRPLAGNASVAAVSGNILVRNWRRSVTTAIQGIEYLVSDIARQDLCRRARPGLLHFRRLRRLSPQRVGVGRRHGRGRRRGPGFHHPAQVLARASRSFSPSAPFVTRTCLKPFMRSCASGAGGSAIRQPVPQISPSVNSFAPHFVWREAAHQWDLLLFTGLPTPAFPFYLGWLFATFGATGSRPARRGRHTLVCSGPGLFRRRRFAHQSPGLLAFAAVPAHLRSFFDLCHENPSALWIRHRGDRLPIP